MSPLGTSLEGMAKSASHCSPGRCGAGETTTPRGLRAATLLSGQDSSLVTNWLANGFRKLHAVPHSETNHGEVGGMFPILRRPLRKKMELKGKMFQSSSRYEKGANAFIFLRKGL